MLVVRQLATGTLSTVLPSGRLERGRAAMAASPGSGNVSSQVEVSVMAAGDSSEVRTELDRRRAASLVFDALTAAIPGLRVEALDERQELYADLGMDSLAFVQTLVELESKLDVPLLDEDLMTNELVNVADLVDLVERISPPAAK